MSDFTLKQVTFTVKLPIIQLDSKKKSVCQLVQVIIQVPFVICKNNVVLLFGPTTRYVGLFCETCTVHICPASLPCLLILFQES